ncbi:MAG: hypothetical protein KF851_08710 [Pirellulaceae bacterium]|jgi:hypothetical protein|nr:hypothetical protein [Pirellulaceae bacterium]
MSLMAILYHLVPESPVLVAYNHDAPIGTPSPVPAIHSGKPRVLASVDPNTTGTNLGVNQNGLIVGMVDRRKLGVPSHPESLPILLRQLLKASSAQRAMSMAMDALSTGNYLGADFIIADAEGGWLVRGGDDVLSSELEDGLTIIGSTDVDDPRDERIAMAHRLLTLQNLNSPIKFLAVASKVFARGPSIPGRPSMVVRRHDYETVSSTLVALGKKPRDAIYQFAAGAPDEAKYEDFSPMLRDILSRGIREARAKASV